MKVIKLPIPYLSHDDVISYFNWLVHIL
jgi:hypothetical protein